MFFSLLRRAQVVSAVMLVTPKLAENIPTDILKFVKGRDIVTTHLTKYNPGHRSTYIILLSAEMTSL